VPAGTPSDDYRLELVLYEEDTGRPLAFREQGMDQDVYAVDLGHLRVARSTETPSAEEVLSEGIDRARMPARFGEDIELWAWRPLPESLAPGDRLFLHLFWRARRAPAEDYQLVVNLRDAAGRIWHTSTHPLTGVGLAPTDWLAGEYLRGIVAVVLPADAPAGHHTVHLLVYAPRLQRFLWVGRGPLPWTGKQLAAGGFIIE